MKERDRVRKTEWESENGSHEEEGVEPILSLLGAPREGSDSPTTPLPCPIRTISTGDPGILRSGLRTEDVPHRKRKSHWSRRIRETPPSVH